MDTQYTQGFKAGMSWREEQIIKQLEKLINNHREANAGTIGHCACPVYEYIIAVIKGHENV